MSIALSLFLWIFGIAKTLRVVKAQIVEKGKKETFRKASGSFRDTGDRGDQVCYQRQLQIAAQGRTLWRDGS